MVGKQRALFIFFVIVLFTAAIFGIAVYSPRKGAQKRPSSQTAAGTGAMTSPLPNGIGSWETYVSDYGYSVRYPVQAELINCGGRCNYEFQLRSDNLMVTFVPIDLSGNKSISEIVHEKCLRQQDTIRQEMVGKLPVYRCEETFSENNIHMYAIVTTNRDDLVIGIQANAKDQESVGQFNKVLSTFRLTQ